MPGTADDEFEPETVEDEDLPADEDETPEEEDEDEAEDEAADEEEFAVEFDTDEGEPGPESSVIRTLRAQLREARTSRPAEAVKPVEVGPKPTLDGCDYDEAKFEAELDAWKDRKAQDQAAQSEAERQNLALRGEYEETLAGYARAKTEIKVRDYDVAEATVDVALSTAQSACLLSAAEKPAALVYALGKHPGKLAALAAITNPAKFGAAVAKLEGSLKMTTKARKAPAPEETVRGSAQISKGADKVLDRLEREADRTGDRTKIMQYKREQRAKAEARR